MSNYTAASQQKNQNQQQRKKKKGAHRLYRSARRNFFRHARRFAMYRRI